MVARLLWEQEAGRSSRPTRTTSEQSSLCSDVLSFIAPFAGERSTCSRANAGCTCPLPSSMPAKGFRGQRLHRLLVRLWCPSRCVLRRSMTHCCAFVHRQLLNPPKKYGAIWSRIFLYFWSVPGPFPRPSKKQRQIESLLLFTSFNICSTADFCCPVR